MAQQRLDDVDYYVLLRLERDATADAIKRAFHIFARKYHPDQVADDPARRARYAQVYRRGTEAYRVLNNPEARHQYDLSLADGVLRFDPGQQRTSRRPSMRAPSLPPKARPFVMKGDQALAAGRLKDACLNYRIALQHDPDNVELKAKLAQAEAVQG